MVKLNNLNTCLTWLLAQGVFSVSIDAIIMTATVIIISAERLEEKSQRRRPGATQAGDLQSLCANTRSFSECFKKCPFREAAR
jgi:hypothetical protein